MIINGKEFSGEIEMSDAGAYFVHDYIPFKGRMKPVTRSRQHVFLDHELPVKPVKGPVKTGDIKLYGKDCLVVITRDTDTGYEYTPLGRLYGTETRDLREVFGNDGADVEIYLK